MPLRPRVIPVAAAALLAGAGPEGYVPDERCASCHRAIWESYRSVGMARSFARPRPEDAIEDFGTFLHEPSRRHYEMALEDGRYLFRRWQVDPDGRRVNEIEQPVDWIIGSGDHSRGYLYRNEAGELFQLPIAWYTQEGSWGMAPGYDEPDHDGVTRPITRECMFCHNAYPDVPAGSDAFGMPHVFPADLPEGTGCQRCHGPGADHVRLANDLEAGIDEVTGSIVNPARLPPARRDDVCFQCHLQPTSKRTSLVRRFGRADYDYRPGDDLAEHVVHLDFGDDADREQRFEINHHAYRLRRSTCYRESGDALTCTTCHDPHRVVPPDRVAGHYRDRCLSCHALDDCVAETMGDDCVSCHMPKRPTQDVVRVVMTDHLIARRPPAAPPAALVETDPPRGGTVEAYFPRRCPPAPEGDLYRMIAAAADGDLDALDRLEALTSEAFPRTIEPWIHLGTTQLRAGRYRAALNSFTMVLGRSPGLALPRANAGVALAGIGEPGAAARLLTDALDIDPRVPDAHYNLALASARMGAPETARHHYEEAVRLRPHYTRAWLNLGNFHARRARYEPAIAAYRRALAVDPDDAASARNLGTALRYLGDWPEAVRVWRHASTLRPDDAALAGELALAFLTAPDVSVLDAAEGLAYAERGVEAAPTSPRPVTILALALLYHGREREALDTATRARELGADESTCRLIMAIAHRRQGRDDLAAEMYTLALGEAGRTPGTSRLRETLLEIARREISTP